MLGMQSCEMSFSSTLEGGGHVRTSIRSRKIKIVLAILSSVYRLRMPISTAHNMCEANKSTAQPKDDDLTEHYEFNWCLRSPLGGRLLRPSVSQYHHDVPRTRCEKQATGYPPSILALNILVFVSAWLPSSSPGHHPMGASSPSSL